MENNSRLDRLFILLKSGSSATRNSASSQLGRLTSSNPEGLPHLLSRLAVVFKSPDWEARIAAGHALGEILKNLSPWDPSNSCSSGSSAVSSLSGRVEESPSTSTSTSALSERLSFESLCLDHILSQGTFLRSESKPEADSSSLQEQRSHLEDTLGLPSKELVSNEDLLTHPETCSSPPPPKRLKWDFQSSPPGPEDSLLSPFIQDMFRELFAESWEVRHGSSTALREIIKYHGDVGGTKRHLSVHQNKALHREWLRELAVKFLCLLALDRFGDFASDTVVAPVRETGAQALGYVAKWMEEEDVGILVQSLLSLMERKEWQCRHGGLLAVKYLLALREEQTTESLLAQIFPSVFAGLTDSMDDVVSVAASSLLPVTDILPSCLSKSQLSDLTNRLWESLLDLDDLTASTHSLIKLLSNLLVSLGDNLSSVLLSTSSELVPRIYPLLSHTSSLVRQSSLEALETLISTQDLSSSFLPQTIKDLSIHLFQRALLEHQPQNLELIESVWRHACRHTPIGDLLLATCPLYGPWLLLVSQPPSWPLSLKCGPSPLYLGGPEAQHTTDPEEKSAYMMRARILACRLLGFLAGFVVQRVPNMTYTEDPMNQFVGKIILPNLLNSRSAYHRTTICLVISEWEALCPPFDKSSLPETLKAAFLRFLAEAVSYDETISAFKALQSEASDLWANLKHYNIPLNVVSSPLTYEHIQSISDIPDEAILRSNKIRPKAKTSLTERKAGLSSALGSIKKEQSSLCTMTQAVIAGSAISLRALPEKLHPVIKPLMESIKKESNAQLQSKAATKLADIMEICTEKSPSSNDKIIKNLITFASSDNLLTPELIEEVRDEGILSHFLREKSKSLSLKSRKNGSKSTEEDASIGLSLRLKNEIQRRGAISALQAIVRKFGNLLELKIPKLWDSTVSLATSPPPTNSVNVVVKALQALEVMIPSLHTDLTPSLEVAVQTLCRSHAKASSSSLRYMASRVIAEIALLIPKVTLTAVIKTILPALESTELNERRGGIEVIICILDRLGIKIVPYIVLLLVPVLGRMSDNDSQVRLLASNCFATLVRLMPLDNDTTNGGGSTSNGHDDLYYSQEILEKKNSERKFIHQLMDAKNAEYFHIPEKVMSTELLRSYQRSGVNWLAFLNRYKLHGILCDDMGLGKTLQSICVLAGDHYNRAQNIQACSLPSLVICPPTLRWHWKEEILKFTKDKFLSPLLYNGSARSDFEGHNVVVTSYDLVRKDVEFLKGIQWNYIILDEGHVIKNAKTKTTLAIKSLNSQHRLILSGTPIQNSVLEIWSLFDFLMPGYLGSERDFSSKFSRPIIASRESKCSKRDKEAGALATESLHRQILPFVLRRMKEDVLKDLPPKITQDYYCDLSPLQVQLYEEYTLKQELGDLEGGESSSKAGLKSHIFQALQYLRKVCNHPKLVSDELKESQDISVAAKLPALRDLLLECGIGIMDDGGGGEEATNLASQHRALIFFQLKSMMNIVEVDLLKRLMPSVTYLRLDGSVPTNKRHDIVQRFNNDVSIDLLLLSTSVGGLGLNLTGADTVIFAEHDWNPMKDLQAMDRAHRIGQKKVVNVYRLITRNTIEEKILGLQKFKLKTANTVISSENSSIESMGTDQIFDLFSLEDKEDGGGEDSQSNSSKKKSGIKSILNSLPELWDEKQYEEEYDLNTFITKNKSSS